MASTLHCPATVAVAGSFATGSSSSDLLRTSKNWITGVPLNDLGRPRFGTSKRDLKVSAKLRKGKKRDYPWSKELDPNVKGGFLRSLNTFQPLKEKPKPLILEFEKHLVSYQKQIIDLQKMSTETGMDFDEKLLELEDKYQKERRKTYQKLTPIQRVQIARHPNRPTFLDHVFNITEKFVELHGDRGGYDDPAIVCGLGTIQGRTYMFMGHQKGRNTKENIKRNFGMPTPHGYRKALRFMYYADQQGFPIITFIDTPGAFADLKCEELGQGEAIAHNLRSMFGLKVPVISIVMGEGGSGGALAIGCANKLVMLENAVFYVASPEACAAILWKTAKESPKAARKLRITAAELMKLQICDGIIPEPVGGAHADPEWTSEQIKIEILQTMEKLDKLTIPELIRHRALKHRRIAPYDHFPTQLPKVHYDATNRRNPVIRQYPNPDKLNLIPQHFFDIPNAKVLSKLIPGLSEKVQHIASIAMVLDLEELVLQECLQALRQSSLHEEFQDLVTEYCKGPTTALDGKIRDIIPDFWQMICSSPAYDSISFMLNMLNSMLLEGKVIERTNGIMLKVHEELNGPVKSLVDEAHSLMKNATDEVSRYLATKTNFLLLYHIFNAIVENESVRAFKSEDLYFDTSLEVAISDNEPKSEMYESDEEAGPLFKMYMEYYNEIIDRPDIHEKLQEASESNKPDKYERMAHVKKLIEDEISVFHHHVGLRLLLSAIRSEEDPDGLIKKISRAFEVTLNHPDLRKKYGFFLQLGDKEVPEEVQVELEYIRREIQYELSAVLLALGCRPLVPKSQSEEVLRHATPKHEEEITMYSELVEIFEGKNKPDIIAKKGWNRLKELIKSDKPSIIAKEKKKTQRKAPTKSDKVAKERKNWQKYPPIPEQPAFNPKDYISVFSVIA